MKNNAQKVIDAFMNLDAKIYILYQAADKTDMFSKDISKCISLCEKYMLQFQRLWKRHGNAVQGCLPNYVVQIGWRRFTRRGKNMQRL